MMTRARRFIVGLAAFLSAVLWPPVALPDELSGVSVGQTIRITPPGRIEIPGVITVQGDQFETKGAFLKEEGRALLTVEVEQQTLHIPRPGTRPVGKLVAADARAITILRDGKPIAIPREAVGAVEVRRAKGHLILIGAALGAGVGFAIGHAATSEARALEWPAEPLLAVSGAVVGALAGTMIGGDRWQTVPSERLGVSVAPRHDGAALAISLSF